MTVPIQISWDLYLGKLSVWCECVAAGARRAVLLPRLETIFAPLEEDPARELPQEQLDWRLVSPTEADWARYFSMVEKQARRTDILHRAERVETVARWKDGRPVLVPQYHIWLYREAEVGSTITRLYETPEAGERRGYWQWLLAWTSPVETLR